MYEAFVLMDRVHAVEMELLDACGVSLSAAQIMILIAGQPVSAGPVTIGDLAAALDRQSPVVTLRVKRLVAKGLIRRVTLATDQRIVYLLLEPKAELILPQIREILTNCDLLGAGSGRSPE